MQGSVLNQVRCTIPSSAWRRRQHWYKYGIRPDMIMAAPAAIATWAASSPRSWARAEGKADYRIIAVEPQFLPSFIPAANTPLLLLYRYGLSLAKMLYPRQRLHPCANHAGGLAITHEPRPVPLYDDG